MMYTFQYYLNKTIVRYFKIVEIYYFLKKLIPNPLFIEGKRKYFQNNTKQPIDHGSPPPVASSPPSPPPITTIEDFVTNSCPGPKP